jgi:hypothetical protein
MDDCDSATLEEPIVDARSPVADNEIVVPALLQNTTAIGGFDGLLPGNSRTGANTTVSSADCGSLLWLSAVGNLSVPRRNS